MNKDFRYNLVGGVAKAYRVIMLDICRALLSGDENYEGVSDSDFQITIPKELLNWTNNGLSCISERTLESVWSLRH